MSTVTLLHRLTTSKHFSAVGFLVVFEVSGSRNSLSLPGSVNFHFSVSEIRSFIYRRSYFDRTLNVYNKKVNPY